MYSSCLFCQSDLGSNDGVEHFPVGKRLAFDAAKGRLWVVCRRCERWNLTPLEERWEAIEECERAFRATTLRVSTDHIGLARLAGGLELVRIGAAQRPEMAAWRYGDQFGRRHRKRILFVAGGAVVVGTVLIAGPVLGLVGGAMFSPALSAANAASGLYRSRKIYIPMVNDRRLPVRLSDVEKTELFVDGEGIQLRLSLSDPGWLRLVKRGRRPWWAYDDTRVQVDLVGEDAMRAARVLLPRLNQGGGSRADVNDAVKLLEAAPDHSALFRNAADSMRPGFPGRRSTSRLAKLSTPQRLALEMAVHEETERRALDGELNLLEAAWKEAEEIARIADDMFLPDSVEADLARLRGRSPQ